MSKWCAQRLNRAHLPNAYFDSYRTMGAYTRGCTSGWGLEAGRVRRSCSAPALGGAEAVVGP